MINFLLVVNKRGQPRVRKYYDGVAKTLPQETEIVKKCLSREDTQCNFFDHHNTRVVYRKYGSLYFIIGITDDENELAIWEFIQNIVETFNEYFTKVTEVDIMVNMDRVYMILDEMIANGRIVESTQSRILAPLYVMDHAVNK